MYQNVGKKISPQLSLRIQKRKGACKNIPEIHKVVV